MRILLVLLPVLLFIPFRGDAQVNIERLRWSAERDGFSALCDLGLSLRTGNTQVADLSASGTIGWRGGKNLVFLVGMTDYGEKSGAPYANEWMTHLRYNRIISPAFSWEGFVQVQKDAFRLLADRELYGTGPRLASGNKALSFAVGIACMLEVEHYEDIPGGESAVRNYRASSYFVLRLPLAESAVIEWVGYVQPRLDDFTDLKMIGEGAVLVRLRKSISLKTTLRMRYDSNPPSGVRDFDLLLKNGLSLNFD